MLQADEERTVLSGEEVPFAPVQVAAAYPRASTQELLYAWSQKWRMPLTLVFGLLIAGAAFFAYESKQDESTVLSEAPNDPRNPSQAAAAVAAEAGDTSDDDTSDDADGAGDDDGRSRSTTTRRTTTTAADDDDDRSGTARPTTSATTPTSPTSSGGGSSTASTEPSTTSTPSSTQPTVTASSTVPSSLTTTSRPTSSTTSTTVVSEPVFIGDRVSTGDWDGPGFPNLSVTLLNDSNRDGVGEDRVGTATTNGNGNYGFDPDPGCYVVVFSVPNGMSVLLGETVVPVCLESGQSFGRADLVLGFPNVRAPASCNIQIADHSYAGVEIWDPNRDFAPSYVFYGSSGQVIVRTADLGPPDDITNPSREYIEWTSQRFGYEESRVYSVAAVDSNGFESVAVTCERRNI